MRSASVLLALLVVIPTAAATSHAQWPVNGVPLCSATGVQQGAAVAFDGHGAIVAWEDSRAGAGTADIYARRLLPSGNVAPEWPADGFAVCVAANAQQSPQIASDGAGGAYIVWQDQRNGVSNYGVYMQRVTRDGEVAGGWPVDGIAVCDTILNQTDPRIVADGAGGAYVVWADARSGAASSSIFARRIQANGSSAPGWPTSGVAVCVATDQQILPVMARDGTNGVVITWLDRRSGDYDVYAMRLTPSGSVATGWASDGSLVSRTPGTDEQSVVVASDGAGGLFALWIDYRAVVADVFAQHLGANGLPVSGWASDGQAVCNATGQQLAPRMIADGTGGFFATWEDYRGAGDAYVTRVKSDGTPEAGWAANGVPLCNAAGFQIAPQLASDGAGGVFATWTDTRNASTNNDLYVTRVDGNGTVHTGWTANGNVLCNEVGAQQSPALQADGDGGAWFAWQDRRNLANFDIYGGRVGPDITVIADAQGSAQALRFEAGPSPFRTTATLRLRIAAAGVARVEVFDVHGRRLRVLVDRALQAGDHAWTWDGRDERGAEMPAGMYLARAIAPGLRSDARLVRVR